MRWQKEYCSCDLADCKLNCLTRIALVSLTRTSRLHCSSSIMIASYLIGMLIPDFAVTTLHYLVQWFGIICIFIISSVKVVAEMAHLWSDNDP